MAVGGVDANLGIDSEIGVDAESRCRNQKWTKTFRLWFQGHPGVGRRVGAREPGAQGQRAQHRHRLQQGPRGQRAQRSRRQIRRQCKVVLSLDLFIRMTMRGFPLFSSISYALQFRLGAMSVRYIDGRFVKG